MTRDQPPVASSQRPDACRELNCTKIYRTTFVTFLRDAILAFIDGYKFLQRWTGIYLTRPAELPVGIIHAFFPLGDPTRQSANGKHYGKHIGGDADGPQNDSAVKVDIGIQMVFYEIIIF